MKSVSTKDHPTKLTLLLRIRECFRSYINRERQFCLNCAEAGDVVTISPITTLWRKRCPRCGSKRLAWFCLADIGEIEDDLTPGNDNSHINKT
ncbi:MAG: hypothetical protein AMXMBFR82_48510 [Candidatus Hydrogenedentota bacterium]